MNKKKIGTFFLFLVFCILFFTSASFAASNTTQTTINPTSKDVGVKAGNVPIGTALDNNLTWTTGGNANWFGYDNGAYDYAENGDISDSQQTWVQTTVNGPGTVTFYWQTSSESYDKLIFYVDGVQKNSISGITGSWQYQSWSVTGESNHILKWVYSKDGSISSGQDKAWLDSVTWSPTWQNALEDNLAWTTGGNANWFTHWDGSYDVAKSGLITNSQQTWIQTTVNGPGTVTFYWKASSESWDKLSFYIDNVLKKSISGVTGWNWESYAVTGTGNHILKWVYSKDSSISLNGDYGILDTVTWTPTLANALDNNLPWTTGGNANWFGTYNGFDYAQSGNIDNSQQSWIQTTVNGPGTVTFYWKASSESWDKLSFYIDNVLKESTSGSTAWVYKSYAVTGIGNHILKWVYSKDSTVSSYDDCGFLETVTWTPSSDTTAPTVTSIDPANNAVKVSAGKTILVTFSENIMAGSMYIELKNSSKTAIPFTTSINGKVLTIDPTISLAESLYTLCIHTGAVTDLVGNPVALMNSKFSTGTSPTVTKVDPANGSTKVARNKVIKVTFNENIKKGTYYIELKASNGTKVVINKSISGKVLTISHALLKANTKYTLIIHTGAVTDLAGNPNAIKTFSFTTGNT